MADQSGAGTVTLRDVTRYGLHRLHVIFAGVDIQCDQLVERVYEDARSRGKHVTMLESFGYECDGIRHLRVWWKEVESEG